MNELTKNLDDAIALIEEMKEILSSGGPDAPLAFLEAAHDAQEQINRTVRAALAPLLNSDGLIE